MKKMSKTLLSEDARKRGSINSEDDFDGGTKLSLFRKSSKSDKDSDGKISLHGSTTSLNLGVMGSLKQSMLNLSHSIQQKVSDKDHKSSVGSIDTSLLPPKANKKSSKKDKEDCDTVSLSGNRISLTNNLRQSFMSKFKFSGKDRSKKKDSKEITSTLNELAISVSRLSLSELDVREEKPLSPFNPASSPKSPIDTTPALSPTGSKEISYPRAVNDEKLQEFTSSKQSTIQQMLNEAMHQYQTLKEEFDKHPNDVTQTNLENKEKVIRRLKSQLSQTGENPLSATVEGSFRLSASGASVKEPDRRSCCMENSASSLDDKEDSSSSSCGLPPHATHAPYNMKKGKLKSRNAYLHNSSLSRSHSDSYKQRQQYLVSLKPSVSSDDFRSMVDNAAIGKRRQNSVLSRSHSKSQGGTSDDADLLHPLAEEHSASSLDVSNSTNSISGHRNSQQSITIMAFDEEDVSDEGERRENHFSKFEEIRNKPAHLAVFLHYLISNSDPAPLLFYLVTEGFSQGSGKDVRRWAYELYTTFLYEKAPLKFVVTPTSILDAIAEVLSNKSEKDDKLTHLFEHVRSVSLTLVKELFGDFRSKLSLGLGSFYGEHELRGVNNHASEISLIDKYLWRQFTTLTSEENDRSSATCSAMLTYFRSIGLPQANNYMDRFPPFVYKEKTKFSMFSKSNKKITTQSYDHNLQQHQYYTITYCNACQGLIGGVGFQGYICLKCEHNFHKSCMGSIKDRCKRVDRSKTTPNILRKKISVKGNVPMKQGELDQADFSILPRASSLMSLMESGKSSRLRDKDRGIQSIVKDTTKDTSVMTATKLLRDDSVRSDQTSASLATMATKLQPSEPYRGGSPEPDDESKEFYDPVNKFFPNQHIPALSNNSQVEISSDSDFEAENDVPLLESYIPKDYLRKMKPKEKKRQNIINELFHTERTHVRNMKVMHHVIFLRMNNEFQKDFVILLFPNLEELIRVHDELNKEFKKKKKESENQVVENFADILIRHFTGERSEEFKKVCAVFCEKQSHALEKLKVRQKKDQKLSSFLQEAANNPLCRRFELKDLLPTAMQRLTKYPLFISSLLKYTSDSEECKKLELALEGSKAILEHVDKAVQRYEDHLRLVDMQKKLDKKAIEAATSGPLAEYRNLDLTRHTLVFDGPLTWRITKDRLIPLHVVLLEDILLLLQKQDDRLVLKCQSMYIAAGKVDTRMTHSPIIKLVNLLIKPVATDHSAFFIVSQITEFPQIYDLIAPSKEEKDKWCRRITAALEAYKLVNPEAWKVQTTHSMKQKVHNRTSAPTSPVVDGSSSMPLIHDSSVCESEETARSSLSVASTGNRSQFSFESQLSNTTLTDLPLSHGEEVELARRDEDDDDVEDRSRFDRDDGDEHSRLIKLRKMDEKIHRVMRDKRTLVDLSLYHKRVEEAAATDEASQKPSPTDTLCAVQSLLLELDNVLKFCNEMESREATPSLHFDEAGQISDEQRSDSTDVQSSKSLVVLPSRSEISLDDEVRTDLISSRSDSQLSSATKLEQTPGDLPHLEPTLSEESRGEEMTDAADLRKDVGGEATVESEDDAPLRLSKFTLLRTCHSLQTELRNLLELILTDQTQNQAFAEEQAELERDSRPAEDTESSVVEALESRHDRDSTACVFEHSSDNLELENPENKEQNSQSDVETLQPPESVVEATNESS